jgi:hypothetical protein
VTSSTCERVGAATARSNTLRGLIWCRVCGCDLREDRGRTCFGGLRFLGDDHLQWLSIKQSKNLNPQSSPHFHCTCSDCIPCARRNSPCGSCFVAVFLSVEIQRRLNPCVKNQLFLTTEYTIAFNNRGGDVVAGELDIPVADDTFSRGYCNTRDSGPHIELWYEEFSQPMGDD